jgi:hypothetical protein
VKYMVKVRGEWTYWIPESSYGDADEAMTTPVRCMADWFTNEWKARALADKFSNAIVVEVDE